MLLDITRRPSTVAFYVTASWRSDTTDFGVSQECQLICSFRPPNATSFSLLKTHQKSIEIYLFRLQHVNCITRQVAINSMCFSGATHENPRRVKLPSSKKRSKIMNFIRFLLFQWKFDFKKILEFQKTTRNHLMLLLVTLWARNCSILYILWHQFAYKCRNQQNSLQQGEKKRRKTSGALKIL